MKRRVFALRKSRSPSCTMPAEVCSTGLEMLICEYYDDMCTKFQKFYK